MYIWLSKSAPEKVFSKKLNFLELKQVFQLKNMFFLLKLVLVAHFTQIKYTILKSE
jgi:hypothetical protein